MDIKDAEWTPNVNLLIILCRCGTRFKHRADRQHIRCPACGHYENLHRLRNV